ncbi:potassium channel family protein [Inquilinus sp. Marseille-Q2685]|uniref:potassium channel family protein n=1 Tax=Inquilinus sp. Marseille-Q2685 TaxID=2866581 RepID=UPI001CE467A7|nr:potassium channel family protein [Inquilinus sp. Marseille-Q2685]
MLGQLLVGLAVSLVNIAVHAAAMQAMQAPRRWALTAHRRAPAWILVPAMIATVAVLMLAHLAEIGIWALVYDVLGVIEWRAPGDGFYFAFVNYTTLGYGDVVPAPRWRLLGPMTTLNGILLAGWSTAVIFDTLIAIGRHLREHGEGRDVGPHQH